jgi:hypothetical protein
MKENTNHGVNGGKGKERTVTLSLPKGMIWKITSPATVHMALQTNKRFLHKRVYFSSAYTL